MSVDDVRYFRMVDHEGLEPDEKPHPKKPGEFVPHPNAGEPGPLVEMKLTIATPEIIDGELFQVATEIVLPDPRYAVIADAAARVFKVFDPIIANALNEHDLFIECEPLKEDQPRKPKPATSAEEE